MVERADFEPLVQATGFSMSLLKSLTLESMVGFLWNEPEARGTRKWLLPTVDKHRKAERFGQQVCPACLRDDVIPYFRKSWRLAFHVMCPKHRTLLTDRCPFCSAPIFLDRLDLGMFVPTSQAVAYRCWKCGEDLRESPEILDVNPNVVEHQMLLLDTLRRGWINVDGCIVYSTQFFEGLWILWSFLDDNRWSKQLGVSQETCFPSACARSRRSLSHNLLENRYELLRKSAKYLESWPGRFIQDMSDAGISGGKVFRFHKRIHSSDVPYWFWKPIHLQLDQSMYVPPDEEIAEAIKFVLARDGFVRCSEVARALNMRTRSSSRVNAKCRHC